MLFCICSSGPLYLGDENQFFDDISKSRKFTNLPDAREFFENLIKEIERISKTSVLYIKPFNSMSICEIRFHLENIERRFHPATESQFLNLQDNNLLDNRRIGQPEQISVYDVDNKDLVLSLVILSKTESNGEPISDRPQV